ncbi:hypothetical protein M9Y10_043838 [Tritrichomonas musculus]|uniref:Uncharacterized protein n=1 Tax=Tritrichomonas musculus TaxID=1915356 RepID=A0ABR2K0T1_9EUKA
MSVFQGSIRTLRRDITTLNLSIINHIYDQVSPLLQSILPQIQYFINDKDSLSRILVNFDFHGLFSYLFLMNQKKIDLKNAIYFLSILCKTQIFDPRYLLNKQNVLLIFSLIDANSTDPPVISVLLTILCKLTTPYSLSYLLFYNNNLFQRIIDYKIFFPISHILYHVVLSSFHDNYALKKQISVNILRSSLKTLQSKASIYENEQLMHEEIAYSLKIFAIFIKNSTFPIDFNIDILLNNRQIYLKGPEIIQESFLDFIYSYDSVGIEILNEILPFFTDRNIKSSLTAVKIFKKSLFEQDNEPDDIDEDSEEEEKEEENKNTLNLSLFPILPNIISELYQKEPKIVQDEALPLVVELFKIQMITSDLFSILCSRISTDYISIEIISHLIDEFNAGNKAQIGLLPIGTFYQILNIHLNDLKTLSIRNSQMPLTPNSTQLLSKISQSIDSYNGSKKQT